MNLFKILYFCVICLPCFALLGLSTQSLSAQTTYTVHGTTILKNGVPWVGGGVNSFDQFGLSTKAGYNIQIVREVIDDLSVCPIYTSQGSLSTSIGTLHPLQDVVANNEAQNQVTVLCMFGWDTGSNSQVVGDFPASASFYSSYKTKLTAIATAFKNNPDVWIEVWNEPYPWNNTGFTESQWLSDMNDLYNTIRATGNNNIIVIPGQAEEGQEGVLEDQATAFLTGKTNVVGGIHCYNGWTGNSQSNSESRIQAIRASGWALFFGEVGPDPYVSNCTNFLNATVTQEVPTLGWSWNSNDGDALVSGGVPTTWGSEFFPYLPLYLLSGSGPVGYWQFNEGAGSTTADSSGNGDTGTLVSNPTWIAGKLGGALAFNGSTGCVTLGNSSTSVLKTSLPVTISAWVKLSSNTVSQIIFASDEWDAFRYAGYNLQLTAGGLLQCNYGTATGGNASQYRCSKVGTTVLSTNVWYHVAAVIQGSSSMSLYVNGVNDNGTYSGTGGAMGYSTASSNIGTGGSANYFDGAIDDVRVYDRPLNSTEIGLLAGGPLSNWRFDEAVGATTSDSGAAGISGTLINSPSWTTGWLDGALAFNGSNNYVNLNDASTSSAIKPTLPVTVSAWIKLSSNTTSQMIFASDEWDASKYAGYSLQVTTSGILQCNIGTAAGGNQPQYRASKVGSTVLGANQWYFVVAVIRSASNMSLYVNGVDDGGTYSGTGTTMGYTSASSKIATGGAINFTSGVIDDVRVYNYSLTIPQIQTLNCASTGIIPPE